MIPDTTSRELVSSGATTIGMFSLSQKNSAHIQRILRDMLYTDKPMAVLREYGANAWDAHRSVGKSNLPIKVTIPTSMEPTLSIRDYGPGLSQAEIVEVFMQYGESTKRGNNNENGMFGIGCKSGFAYSDSFTVTSWHGGMKRIYVAVLDKTNTGQMNLLHEEACDPAETGVEIQVSVRPDDVSEFHRKAVQLYQHFEPRPEINCQLPAIPENIKVFDQGYIFASSDASYDNRGWTAVMGCVPYRINPTQLRDAEGNVPPFIENISGVLKLPLGSVDISASREELEYSSATKTLIMEKIQDLIDSFVMSTLADISATSSTGWERRNKAQIFKRMFLPVPATHKEMAVDYVKIVDVPASFMFVGGKKKLEHASTLAVGPETRLVIRDDMRTISGFDLPEKDLVVRKLSAKGWEHVEKDLNEWLLKKELDGVTVVKLSNMTWTSPAASRGSSSRGSSSYRVKPNHKVFTLTDGSRLSRHTRERPPPSSRWEVIENPVPAPDDVFVVLQKFHPDCDIFSFYENDKMMLKAFGMEMPRIVGYRSTDTSPVRRADVTGTHYLEWRQEILKELFDENQDLMFLHRWAEVADYTYHLRDGSTSSTAAWLKVNYGEAHLITSYMERIAAAQLSLTSKGVLDAVASLYKHFQGYYQDQGAAEPAPALEAILERYPLLRHANLRKVWERSYNKDDTETCCWMQYVQLVDAALS